MSNQATSPRGFVTGTAVIRDKNGNVKGTFSFGGEATQEQVEKAFPDVPITIKTEQP